MGNSTRRAFPPWTRACASHTYCTPLDVHNRQGLPSMRRGRSVGKADVRNDSGRDARPRGGREARPDPAARGPKQKLALPLGATASGPGPRDRSVCPQVRGEGRLRRCGERPMGKPSLYNKRNGKTGSQTSRGDGMRSMQGAQRTLFTN